MTLEREHFDYSRFLISLSFPTVGFDGMMSNGRIPLSPMSADPSSEKTHGT